MLFKLKKEISPKLMCQAFIHQHWTAVESNKTETIASANLFAILPPINRRKIIHKPICPYNLIRLWDPKIIIKKRQPFVWLVIHLRLQLQKIRWKYLSVVKQSQNNTFGDPMFFEHTSCFNGFLLPPDTLPEMDSILECRKKILI